MEVIIIALAFLVVVAAISWGIIVKRRRDREYLSPQDYSETIPRNSQYKFIRSYEDENNKDLPIYLDRIAQKNVKRIYFIHGSYVGDDPFQLFAMLDAITPELGSSLVKKLKSQIHLHKSHLSGDMGNFTNEHINIISQSGSIPVENHIWCSGNNHIARLRGCLDLLLKLATNQKKGDRILLIGHSHAGQILCLITMLLNHKVLRKEILTVISDEKTEMLENHFPKLLSLNYDFVTMGCPVRYKWCLSKKMRLIHFINHRGTEPLGGKLAGAAMTKDGDYVQQWGVAGSDSKPRISKDEQINLKLEAILGVGKNGPTMHENIKHLRRLHNEGLHFLVDYQDDSALPNFFKTLVGHAIYTRRKLLSFHFKMLVDHWYS